MAFMLAQKIKRFKLQSPKENIQQKLCVLHCAYYIHDIVMKAETAVAFLETLRIMFVKLVHIDGLANNEEHN